MTTTSSVVVVGAGMAGVSCALWLQELQVPFRWLDASGRVGGTLHRIYHRLRNYPGRSAANGAELADALRLQVRDAGVPIEHRRVDSVELGESELVVQVHGASPIVCSTMVLATGTAPRTPDFDIDPDIDSARIDPSAHRLEPSVNQQTIVVVGGGDGAFEGALILANAGARVRLLYRSKVRARRSFRAQVEACERIDVERTLVTRVRGGEDGVVVVTQAPGVQPESLEAWGVLLKIGVAPLLPKLPTSVDVDSEGYIVVDDHQESRVHGLYAIGDVAASGYPSLSDAAQQGGAAARRIASRR